MLELHVADLPRERPRLLEQRLKAGALHSVLAAHLFHEQIGISPDVQPRHAVRHCPRERGDKSAVLGDIVRRNANRFLQLDNAAVVLFDADAIAGGTGIAARSAIDVGARKSAALRRPEQ